jgi:hypothetical protein
MCRNVTSEARTDERRALWPLHEGQVRVMDSSGAAPDLGCDIDDQPQLRRLRLHGDRVAMDGAGKAALGRQRELLERGVAGG